MEKSPREIQKEVDESTKLFGKFEFRLKETTLDTTILDHLISKCILSTQDREEIIKKATLTERNAQLLYILKRQPYDAFYFLVEALKEDTDDFENIDQCKILLQEMIRERSNTVPAIPFENLLPAVEDHSVRLQKNFHHLINNIANARQHMDHLYAEGILTIDEMEHLHKQQTTNERNRMLLAIIFAKATSMNVYQTFLEVLGKDNIDKDLVKRIKRTEVLEEEKKLLRIGQLIRKRRMEIGDDFMENYLDQWMYEGIYFVETKGSKRIHSLIKDHKSLVVSGPSGVGKTASVRHVALQLENESYTIIFLREVDDIKQYYKSGRKTLYVVDDLCGNYTGDKKQIKRWKKLEKEIQYRLEHGNCKLIATCRLQVFQDIKSTDLTLFKNECNLISIGNHLTNTEVEKLARMYFQEAAALAKEHLSKYECFPYLCKLYYDNKDKSDFCLQSFLENPFSFLAVELHNLKRGNGKNNKGKLRFCALVLLVISNNNLEEVKLEGKNKMIFDTLQKYELCTNITGKAIRSELDTLIGTFVIKQGQSYCATHEKLFDFLVFYMAVKEELLDFLIPHASEHLICERLSVEENPSEPDSYQISKDCLITIPYKMTQMYIERVFRDIKTSDHVDNYLSNNRNRENGKFKEKLLLYIRKQLLMKDDIDHLICTASSDFISRILSITTIESLHSGSSLDRYAVKIPENCVHMYIERVFKDLTMSNDVEEYVRNNINHTENAFIDRLAEYMTKISKEEKEILLKEASADFVARIFVVSAKNVSRRMSPIDKFHILIPDEYLKIYIAKIFTDLIRSDDIDLYLQNNSNESDITYNEMLIAFMTKITEKEIHKLICDPKVSSSSIKRLFVVGLRDSAQSDANVLVPLSKNILQHIQDNGILNCPEWCVKDYIDRMLDYWKIGKVFDVFKNVNMKNRLFADRFITHLDQLDRTTQLQLAATIDYETKSSTLVVSCHIGDTRLANWCLQNNVDVNSCDSKGGSPLYFASWNNYPEIVYVLLHNRNTTIDVNRCIEDGKTPLFMACTNELEQIVTMLLGVKGIDVNKGSDEGKTPLYAACAISNEHIVALLLQNTSSKIDVNKCTRDGYSPLYEACCEKNTNIVSMLLKHKNLDVNICTYVEETSPLLKACSLNCKAVVSNLLENSSVTIDINRGNIWDETPLIIASERGYNEIVLLLLQKKELEVNKCNDEGKTALIIASEKGYDDIVLFLLENRELDVNKCNDEGKTALYVACDKGYTKVVSLLLKSETHNVDVNICSKNDITAMYAACCRGHTAIVLLILKYKAKEIDFSRSKSLLYTACVRGYTDMVSVILETGKIDVNEVTFWGETPLFASCDKGFEEIVLTLIKVTSKTIDVNKSIDSGETPLYIACYNGHLKIVSTLLACENIDVNKCTTSGKSPLNIASSRGHTNIANLLLKYSFVQNKKKHHS